MRAAFGVDHDVADHGIVAGLGEGQLHEAALGRQQPERLRAAVGLPGRGPGRRPRGHTVTPLGQRELTVQAAESTELVEVFASYLIAEGHGSEEARAIGEAWAARQPEQATAEHETAVDAVIEVLDILGFDPERTNTPDGEGLVLHTCPLLDAAHRNPEFICQVHQGLIDGILKRVGAREGLELLPFSDADGCRIRPTG